MTLMWISVLVMSAITIALRALPLLLKRSIFQNPIVSKLNRTLPLAVIVVLLAHSLAGSSPNLALLWPALLAQLLALIVVAASYWKWRHALLSVALGLAALALISRVMGVQW